MDEKLSYIDYIELVDSNCELSEDELKMMYELSGGVV